jgi:tetratricopeptide (TPR) repeat protein
VIAKLLCFPFNDVSDARVAVNGSAGRYNDALEAGLECRDLVKSHFGEAHPVFASTITNIALMYKNMGQMEQAIESYEFALQTYKASVGEQHASFATTLHNLGLVYRALSISSTGMERVQAIERALECFEESLKVRRAILEPGHPDIALSMCNLGVIYWHSKKPEKAFAMLEEAKDALERKVGPTSALTALAMNNLAYVRKEARDYVAAIDHHGAPQPGGSVPCQRQRGQSGRDPKRDPGAL